MFAAFETAAEAALFGALGAGGFSGLFFLGPLGTLERQTDLPLFGVDAEDLDVQFLADLELVFGFLDLLIADLADVQEPSKPGSSSTKTPKLAILVTWPLTTMPGR